MQCSSYYRDPYETAAWQLYLRECALRTAREEVAFLEAVGGATKEELDRIRQRVMACGEEPVPDDTAMMMQNNNAHMLGLMGQGAMVKADVDELWGRDAQHDHNNLTVSLKSVLADVLMDSDAAINSLCRRVRPLLEQHGIATFKKHQAVHVLRADAQRVRDLGLGLV